MERSKKKTDALLLGFSAWMADRNPRPMRTVTRRQYVNAVKRAMKIATDAGHSIVVGDVRSIRFVLGSIPPNPTTQNGMISALRAFYTFCKSQGLRRDNPALEIGRPPLIKSSPRPIGLNDVCLYLDAAAQLGLEHYAVACFGVYMGLRSREIESLKWADFFEADGRLWADVDGKGGTRKRVYVHTQIRYHVLPQLRERHNDPKWVFPSERPSRRGLNVSSDWARRRHRETIEVADIPYATLHQLRHSFGTYLRLVSGDILVAKEGLRHANVSSTEIYAEVFNEEVADHIENLDFRRLAEEARVKREARGF